MRNKSLISALSASTLILMSFGVPLTTVAEPYDEAGMIKTGDYSYRAGRPSKHERRHHRKHRHPQHHRHWKGNRHHWGYPAYRYPRHHYYYDDALGAFVLGGILGYYLSE
ncbi:hypothetical protein DJ030_06840 [bacterium endosymbiont of Escarpia laminata]|nr:MAG: hypothetical protein DJ031_07205 [bacterium endosymbiont of Escarpia laminata]RLJ20424.1 MAG: hypothetical protein DJ030_06840 [bacterium endosymbiont of Escarpia laminata]